MIGIAGEDDPAADRDRRACEAVWIALAVPALVLVADDASHGAQARDGAQDALADRRVLTHDHPLPLAQRAGLVQDLVRNPDLADVVKERRGADAADLFAVQRQRVAHPRG